MMNIPDEYQALFVQKNFEFHLNQIRIFRKYGFNFTKIVIGTPFSSDQECLKRMKIEEIQECFKKLKESFLNKSDENNESMDSLAEKKLDLVEYNCVRVKEFIDHYKTHENEIGKVIISSKSRSNRLLDEMKNVGVNEKIDKEREKLIKQNMEIINKQIKKWNKFASNLKNNSLFNYANSKNLKFDINLKIDSLAIPSKGIKIKLEDSE